MHFNWISSFKNKEQFLKPVDCGVEQVRNIFVAILYLIKGRMRSSRVYFLKKTYTKTSLFLGRTKTKNASCKLD